MLNEKRLTIIAVILQVFDGLTTYFSITNNIGYEANPYLASLSPLVILWIKVIYACFLYFTYMWMKQNTEYKNYFNICIKFNILLYSIVGINNLMVIL